MARSSASSRHRVRGVVHLLNAAILVAVALSLTVTSALGAGGRLQLNLVNSGPDTAFYPASATSTNPNCNKTGDQPASLSTSKGTGVKLDSPGYAFPPDLAPSRFSYTVPAGWAKIASRGLLPPRLAVPPRPWKSVSSAPC